MLAVNPSLDYIAALFGIMMLGAVPVPCFPPSRPKELDRFHAIVLDCIPHAIVIDAMYDAQVEALQRRLACAGIDPLIFYVDELNTSVAAVAPAACSPDDLALIQYTSGSTGSPKGVCITHDNLMSNCEVLSRSMGPDPNRVGLSWLPPYHDMGLMGTIILSLHHGWPLVLMSPMHFVQEPRRWLEAITEYRVSITVGPNFSLEASIEALDDDIENLDLSTVKEFYCGAEPISGYPGALRRARSTSWVRRHRADSLLRDGGGDAVRRRKTERQRYNTVDGADGIVVSCGEVDSEHVVRIVDPEFGRLVPPGEIGEIWVRGRSVAAGYFNGMR